MIKKAAALTLVIVVLLLAGTWFVFNQLLVVKNIECSLSTGQECPVQFQQTLDQELQNKSIFFTDFEKEFKQQAFTESSFSVTNISKRLPATLKLELEYEPPSYRINQAGLEEKIVVTSQGNILQNMEVDQELPVVTLNSQINLDSSIPAELHQSLQTLVTSLEENQLNPQAIIWNSENEIILIMPNVDQVYLDNQEIETDIQQLSVLKESEEYQKLEGQIKEIDLRFKLPVLRTAQ